MKKKGSSARYWKARRAVLWAVDGGSKQANAGKIAVIFKAPLRSAAAATAPSRGKDWRQSAVVASEVLHPLLDKPVVFKLACESIFSRSWIESSFASKQKGESKPDSTRLFHMKGHDVPHLTRERPTESRHLFVFQNLFFSWWLNV